MVLITLCCYVDNYVKLLFLLCFRVWITLLYVRIARTVLLFCLCDADSICLCATDIFDDGIVFDVWCVVTTLSMFLDIILG